jgi:hypothetical protein
LTARSWEILHNKMLRRHDAGGGIPIGRRALKLQRRAKAIDMAATLKAAATSLTTP